LKYKRHIDILAKCQECGINLTDAVRVINPIASPASRLLKTGKDLSEKDLERLEKVVEKYLELISVEKNAVIKLRERNRRLYETAINKYLCK